MDSGRLGRVLGVGARHAAKTVVGAVDAATSPNPRETARPRGIPTESGRAGTSGAGAGKAATGRAETRETAGQRRGLAEGGRRFGRAVWEPTVRLSGVLWLEVTGMFFGIFALMAAGAAWRLRGALHPGVAGHQRLLWALGMLAVFGYFTASSFLAAKRRGRRRG